MGLLSGKTSIECLHHFVRTIIICVNGFSSLLILTSCLQRLTGNIRPNFLSVCTSACVWPETTFKSLSWNDDLRQCFSNSSQEPLSQQTETLASVRLSFPSLQEGLLSYSTLFITGLWHRKQNRKEGQVIGLLVVTIMSSGMFFLSNSKIIRLENWTQDVIVGSLVGVIVAIHQLVCLFWEDEATFKCSDSSLEHDHGIQVRKIKIPRVVYRRSFLTRKYHNQC